MYYNYQVRNNIGIMKFIFKIENNNNEGNTLIGIALYKVNVLKVMTRFYKCQIKTVIVLSSKSKLMSTNIKVLFLIKAFAE